MIDFALMPSATNAGNRWTPIYQACLLRFRAHHMTTMAALFGAIPLALRQRDWF